MDEYRFKDHREINNNSHLCFPFTAKPFSDLSESKSESELEF